MSHDFVLTEDDAPSGNTHAEDLLELSLLTTDQNTAVVDISWEKTPQDF
ncbi:hypothetical protein [Paenarthrobacter nitroguajacolicus]|nr:hypothetical protein [Paenarthrobacter nitroguajacolicus]